MAAFLATLRVEFGRPHEDFLENPGRPLEFDTDGRETELTILVERTGNVLPRALSEAVLPFRGEDEFQNGDFAGIEIRDDFVGGLGGAVAGSRSG